MNQRLKSTIKEQDVLTTAIAPIFSALVVIWSLHSIFAATNEGLLMLVAGLTMLLLVGWICRSLVAFARRVFRRGRAEAV